MTIISTLNAEAFTRTTREETKICCMSDGIGNEPNFDCFCLDIHLLNCYQLHVNYHLFNSRTFNFTW